MSNPNKFDRKSLKQPDEFVTFTAKIFTAFVQFRKIIIGVLSIGVIAIVGIYFYNGEEAKNLEASSFLFSEAFEAFDALVVDVTDAIDGNQSDRKKYTSEDDKYRASAALFEQLHQMYEAYPYGRVALFYLGHCYYHLGDYDRALSYYQKFQNNFEGPDDLKNLLLDTIGHTHEAKGNIDLAVASYEKIANSGNDFLKDYSFYNLGRCYEEKNDNQKARSFYSRVKSEFPESSIVAMVDKRLALLEN